MIGVDLMTCLVGVGASSAILSIESAADRSSIEVSVIPHDALVVSRLSVAI